MLRLLCLATALTIGLQLAVRSEVLPEKIQDAITKEKVFPPETKLRVSVEGTEAIITTYKISEATTDDDYKIQAVLVGKSVFSTDPSVARVTTRFYDLRNPKDFFEVRVTVGDVKAFATGSISKEQLLSAIFMTKHAEPTVTGTTSGLSSSAATNKLKSPDHKTDVGSAKCSTPTSKAVYENYGLRLSYPIVWTIDHPNSGNTLARLSSRGEAAQSSIIELKLYSGNVTADRAALINPETLFGELWWLAWIQSMRETMGASSSLLMNGNEHHSHHHHGRHGGRRSWGNNGVSVAGVQIPQTMKLGIGKSLTGYQRAYWASAPMSPKEYMRAVSFSSGQYVFQLLLLCAEKNASSANAEFEQILADIKVAGMGAAKQPARAKK